MKKNVINTIVACFGMCLLFLNMSHAQNNVITVTVSDEAGQPVKGAVVTAGEGAKQIYTDEYGKFSLSVETKTPVLIEADGFESIVQMAFPVPVGMMDVRLVKKPYGLR